MFKIYIHRAGLISDLYEDVEPTEMPESTDKYVDYFTYGYTIQTQSTEKDVSNDLVQEGPATIDDLIQQLVEDLPEYLLQTITFDAELDLKEVECIKSAYNEIFLSVNPDVVLIKPIIFDKMDKMDKMDKKEPEKQKTDKEKEKEKDSSDMIMALYINHSTYHAGDSGLDLFCPKKLVIQPGESQYIRFGIACQADSSFWLLPRSSISKTGIRMANSIGLVDKGYRGELMACVDNIKNKVETVEEGSRLFQIAFPSLGPIRPVVTDFLSPTSRGAGGFGSTSK